MFYPVPRPDRQDVMIAVAWVVVMLVIFVASIVIK
jgi:hypothetical protein